MMILIFGSNESSNQERKRVKTMAKTSRLTGNARILHVLVHRDDEKKPTDQMRELYKSLPWLRQQITDTLRDEERKDDGMRADIIRFDRAPTPLQAALAKEYVTSPPEELNWQNIMNILAHVPEHREETGKLVLERLKKPITDLSSYYNVLRHAIMWCQESREQFIDLVLDDHYTMNDECKLALCVMAVMFTENAKKCEKFSLHLIKAAIRLISGKHDDDDDANFFATWCKLWLGEMNDGSMLMDILATFAQWESDLIDKFIEYTKA